MPATAQSILEHLRVVHGERWQRTSSPALAAKVVAIKQYQQQRFVHTYGDLLASERYSGAARFFLDELYGPVDFSERDAQFARVVPALVKLFPQDIVDTVDTLGELHALSERLDTAMAHNLARPEVRAETYVEAWRATGNRAARTKQIELTLRVGSALERFTRKPLLRRALHMMRAPARAAGLGELQRFLEAGFDTFQAMGGAREFLELVDHRERALAEALFGDPAEPSTQRPTALSLAQLP